MGSLGILLAVGGVAGALVLLLLFWYFWSTRRRIRSELERHTRTLMDAVCSSFLTTSCSRCHESEMRLLSVSPNARAIEYQCVYCNKKMFGTACAPEAHDARLAWEQLTSATLEATRQGFNSFEGDFDLVWTVPEDPLPHEYPMREPIPEAVRTEVWRRDNGRCVTCGSNVNLEFDHIIPVSKGGATTVRNLQLLCQSCNRSKGARI